MGNIKRYAALFWVFAALIAPPTGAGVTLLAASTSEPTPTVGNDKLMGSKAARRLRGKYLVKDIQQVSQDHFVVEFTATATDTRPDTADTQAFILDTTHVHTAVTKGATFDVAVELLPTEGAAGDRTTRASQVMILVPRGAAGVTVPVWMLSRQTPNAPLRASKYLDMHVPDYVIL